MNGSCQVKASAALHEGWLSSFLSPLRISGYSSTTVGRRSFFFLLAEFFGCPRTNCPLDALFPRSNQYSNNPEFDVIPISSGDKITGYFDRTVGTPNKVTLDEVIGDGTDLLDLVEICERRQFSFVLGVQDITGYVHFSDLNHHLVKLTFYVMLEALERKTLEGILGANPRSDHEEYLRRNLDPNRFAAIDGQYKRAGQAARSRLSYLNISDILRLAVRAGRVSMKEDIIKDIKCVRDGAAHAIENLVSSYEDVKKLADVKRECLRLLGAVG
jgi:hypothetical protein